MNKEKAIKEIKKASESFYACDYIKTKVAESIISKINEPQKVTVPKFVAEWLKKYRYAHTLLKVLNGAEKEQIVPSTVNDWIKDNQYDFIKAWLDGYEVEKEKLYTVEIPNPNGDNNRYGLCKVDGRIIIGSFVFGLDRATNAKLTESEIKQDFEWAWQLAKEVEE